MSSTLKQCQYCRTRSRLITPSSVFYSLADPRTQERYKKRPLDEPCEYVSFFLFFFCFGHHDSEYPLWQQSFQALREDVVPMRERVLLQTPQRGRGRICFYSGYEKFGMCGTRYLCERRLTTVFSVMGTATGVAFMAHSRTLIGPRSRPRPTVTGAMGVPTFFPTSFKAVCRQCRWHICDRKWRRTYGEVS